MKTLITCLFLLISTMGLAQILNKWEYLIQKEKTTSFSPYYLTSLKKAQQHNYKVVKKLDTIYGIIKNENPKINIVPKDAILVNNSWKLPTNFSNHEQNKCYILFTQNIELLLKDLNLIAIPYIKTYNNQGVIINSNSQSILNQIIPLNSVIAITQESFRPIIESKIIDQNFSINHINEANFKFPLLTGEGQIVSVKDGFFNSNDIDLLNKHIPSTTQSNSISNHASDMATIIAGLGNSSVLGKGVAKKAKLQSSDFLNLYPDDLLTLQGATTQNHSYGTTVENFYGTLAAAYDTQLFENPYITHCFSSGNKGLDGYKSITGNFKQSKNSIVVGAINQNEIAIPFSSIGPAFDGRIKPEVVAYSTQGTSNATAIATGTVALIKQHFKNVFNTNITNSLVKAILINSAKDLGNTGPDFTYGYGSVNANKCMKTISENRFINGNVSNNKTNLHTINVPKNAKNLKITLVWNDLAATINSNVSLVNDVDLQVVSPNNTVYLPWILNPNSPQEPAKTGKDHLNTIEQVVILNPDLEFYNIEITGTFISNVSQDYSIAYQYELQNAFEWNYPITNDNFPYDGKNFSPFKWETSLLESSGKLSISYNNGQTWETINDNVLIKNEQYEYIPVEQKFCQAKLKMTINDTDYLSDSFTISYDLNINTSLVCDGVTEINWDKPTNVSLFNIYELVNDSLQFKEQTQNTNYVYTNQKNCTVVPVINNIEGIKSESTLQYEPNSNCYFELVMAEIFEEEKVKINVNLFSLYNIKKIALIKIVNNSENILDTMDNVSAKFFYLVDANPTNGNNQYKIKIILQNNKAIYSEKLNLIHLGSNSFMVYPTIVNQNKIVNIEAKKASNSFFYLYNLNGQNILTAPILDKTNSINVKNTSSGIYIYKIIDSNGKAEKGKIIIL